MDNVADIIYRGPWYKNRGILCLNLCLFIAIMTSSINGFDSSLLNGLQILPDWLAYFNHPEGAVLGVLGAAQNIGALVAIPLAPFATDGLGRRMTIFAGSLIMLGGVILQALSTHINHFIASRALSE
jgi:MFS family permease